MLKHNIVDAGYSYGVFMCIRCKKEFHCTHFREDGTPIASKVIKWCEEIENEECRPEEF